MFEQQMVLDPEKQMGLSSKPKIKPLLGEKVEAPKNFNIDLNKYEFSKPYTPTDKDTVTNEQVAKELGPNYVTPCSQLTYEADLIKAKEKILELRKEATTKSMFKIFLSYNWLFI